MVVNGIHVPGLEHEVIISTNPLRGKVYKSVNELMIDENVKEAGATICAMVLHHGYDFISLKRNVPIEGRSWEMSAYKALTNEPGIFSGTVSLNPDGVIHFGDVPGKDIKLKVNKNVIFANTL